MARLADQLLSDALALPLVERARLVRELIASFDDGSEEPREELDRAWAAEAQHRASEIDSGEVSTEPAEQVFRAVRERLHARNNKVE